MSPSHAPLPGVINVNAAHMDKETEPQRALSSVAVRKFEILNPKHEMVRPAHHPEPSRRANPNFKCSNVQNKAESIYDFGVSLIWILKIGICLGFRYSNFGFILSPDLFGYKPPKKPTPRLRPLPSP
jgi:hypothetical protein